MGIKEIIILIALGAAFIYCVVSLIVVIKDKTGKYEVDAISLKELIVKILLHEWDS